MTLRASALCSTLGIRHPIIQSGMSRVAGPELVAAVSNAGESVALRTNVVLGARGGTVTGVARQTSNGAVCCYSEVTVSPDYFATLGMRMLRGRAFTAADSITSAPHTVILDDGLAKIVFGDEDPIGRCVVVGFGSSACLEVVGVSESARRGPLSNSKSTQNSLFRSHRHPPISRLRRHS